MKLETTVQRTELTVERTETLTISRTRRTVYEKHSVQERDVADTSADIDLLLNEIGKLNDAETVSPADNNGIGSLNKQHEGGPRP